MSDTTNNVLAGGAAMRLKNPAVTEVLSRRDVYEGLLSLAHARVLELGCGRAEVTREIATRTPSVHIRALEVDRIQHEENLQIVDLPNVAFGLGGAESIPAPDASFDIVLMFGSFHHVPVARLDEALREISRVLKPSGLAYFEEPVFDGEYYEIVKVFHNEEAVREAAFLALKRAVGSRMMELVTEKFFVRHKRFRDWEQFERKVREETHTIHRPTDAQWEAAKARFMQSMTPEGVLFVQPARVDVLRKPSA